MADTTNALSRRALLAAMPAVAATVIVGGCQTTGNQAALLGAAQELGAAALVSNAELARMATAGARELDAQNKLAGPNSAYSRRLATLTKNFKSVDGTPLNFGVYQSPEVNAFAMLDGTVRVYSGLMDAMNDDELTFVLGHEIGHVMHGHTAEKFRIAYATSGVRKLAAAQGGSLAGIAASELGGLVEAVINAQFSQSAEREADDYGLQFTRRAGRPPTAAANALTKLATLGGGAQSDIVSRMLSTHPDPAERAARLRAQGA